MEGGRHGWDDVEAQLSLIAGSWAVEQELTAHDPQLCSWGDVTQHLQHVASRPSPDDPFALPADLFAAALAVLGLETQDG